MRASGEGQRCRNQDEGALTQIKGPSDQGQNQNVIPLTITSLKAACSQCNLRELCLPFGLSEKEILKLDHMVAARRRLKRGQHLLRC